MPPKELSTEEETCLARHAFAAEANFYFSSRFFLSFLLAVKVDFQTLLVYGAYSITHLRIETFNYFCSPRSGLNEKAAAAGLAEM